MSLIKTVEFVNDLVEPIQGPAVLFFHTPWAQQCMVMDSVVEELAKMYAGRVAFFKVDAERFPEAAQRFSVKAVPSFILTEGNLKTVLGRVDGAKPAELLHAVKSLVNQTADVESRCQQLINSHPVMLFIKGTPEAPRCGFTGQLLALLKANGITNYGYYNILEDEPLRQHLKIRSQWPTYPQVYHKGELIGGLDILKEMADRGELSGLSC